MQRISHGFHAPHTASALSSNNNNLASPQVAFLAPQVAPGTVPFSLMFPGLPDEARLSPTEKTLSDLADLGATMQVAKNDTQYSSTPAGYTYFAQFVDHDIAFSDVKKDEGQTDSELLAAADLSPWSEKEIGERVRNKRTIPLQLECVYGDVSPGQPPPRDCQKFVLGKVCPRETRRPDKDEDNDLVRSDHSRNPKQDRVALINDPRNDSNLIVSQIHVAFLRAHNAIADRMKCSFQSARQLLLKHYQWMVFHDILPRFVREEEIKAALERPLYDPSGGVPLEFSVAAFRFGHCLIRQDYYLNDSFQGESLEQLFMLTVLSNNGQKATPGDGCLNLPGNKIIAWQKFLGLEIRNNARRIRPQMVDPLFTLLNEANVAVSGEKRLAVQDLKRGYMLGIPTGQALARIMEVEPLTPDDLKAVAVNPEQLHVLENSEFLEKTPLWFYILAEAAKQNAKGEPNAPDQDKRDKDKLGPVGGRIVAEAITGFIRQTPGSFLNTNWKPSIFCFHPGQFFISDLLRLAGVLEPL